MDESSMDAFASVQVCPSEVATDLDRPSVKERTARRRLSPALPTTAGDRIGRT